MRHPVARIETAWFQTRFGRVRRRRFGRNHADGQNPRCRAERRRNPRIRHQPRDFGIEIRRDLDEIKVANAQESLEKMDEVLTRQTWRGTRHRPAQTPPPRSTAGNVVPSLADGVKAAEAAIDSGKAKAKKEEFVRFTQQFAKE